MKNSNKTTLRSNLVTCFDVDDTLIYWDWDRSSIKFGVPSRLEATIKFDGKEIKKHIIESHVKELKRQKESGALIVVWSASGYQWAEAIVDALDLHPYVDIIMSKPIRIYDDKDPQDWMPKRRYLIENL